jgi:DNA-directed RNA polymerase subunit M/transcription elongation factor TFIIS
LTTESETKVLSSLMSDQRLERMLTIAKEMNDLLSKIQVASAYLAEAPRGEESEPLELARAKIARDLSADITEAKTLLPALEEITEKLEAELQTLEKKRMVNLGLAKIEGLRGSDSQKRFADEASMLQSQASEVQNLIDALLALEKDLLNPRRSPLSCPRCSSQRVSYRITPSDLGYTLYRCDECGNPWKVTEFSMRLSQ